MHRPGVEEQWRLRANTVRPHGVQSPRGLIIDPLDGEKRLQAASCEWARARSDGLNPQKVRTEGRRLSAGRAMRKSGDGHSHTRVNASGRTRVATLSRTPKSLREFPIDASAHSKAARNPASHGALAGREPLQGRNFPHPKALCYAADLRAVRGANELASRPRA